MWGEVAEGLVGAHGVVDTLPSQQLPIMVASEATRKSVAELLHGRVQGRMVVLGHWLSQCQAQLKDGPPEVVESLENANKLLKEIRDQELRTITRQLYPSIIRTGLPTALNSLADRFRSVFEIQVDIDDGMSEMDGPMRPRLGESLRLTLYRVAEEALGNVAKHSYADRASVSLSLAPSEELVLEVQDNGRGFEQSEAHRGLGTVTMEDYVMAMEGTLAVTSAPGIGTTVRVTVPLSTGTESRAAGVPEPARNGSDQEMESATAASA